MDESKKQKMMLALLGVLIVGMGGYYFVFSGSETKEVVTSSAPVEKRVRESVTETEKQKRPEAVSRQTQETEEQVLEKKQRDMGEEEEEAMIKRERDQNESKRPKPKKKAPAA